MTTGNKVDIRGSINDAIRSISSDIIGMCVLIMTFGCLFAPYFTFIIKDRLTEMFNAHSNINNYNMVEAIMGIVNSIAYIVAFIAWTIVIGCFIARQNGLF